MGQVVVRGTDAKGGDVQRIGTGVLVGEGGAFLTSYHTVADPAGGWQVDEFGIKEVRVSVLLRDESTALLTDVRAASVSHADGSLDAAVLSISGTSRPGLATCPDKAIATGDILLIAGVDSGRAGEPPAVDVRSGGVGERRANDAPFVRVSVPTGSGFSGAPVFKVDSSGKEQLVGLLKGGDPLNATSHSLVVPLAAMRDRLLAGCDVACRHPNHGIERYENSKTGDLHISGWQRGGTDPTSYCDAYAAAERRRLPNEVIDVVHKANNDQRFFTGWRGNHYIVRESQYKYECRLRYQSGPIYIEKTSEKCPAPPNPRRLPR